MGTFAPSVRYKGGGHSIFGHSGLAFSAPQLNDGRKRLERFLNPLKVEVRVLDNRPSYNSRPTEMQRTVVIAAMATAVVDEKILPQQEPVYGLRSCIRSQPLLYCHDSRPYFLFLLNTPLPVVKSNQHHNIFHADYGHRQQFTCF